jgi:hypothetical protein
MSAAGELESRWRQLEAGLERSWHFQKLQQCFEHPERGVAWLKTIEDELKGETMAFAGVLETVGKDFAKGLKWALQYAVPVERLAGLIFPAAAPIAAEAVDATTLVQSAILLVEQKYAASGVQASTGAQKLAEVLLLTGQAVPALLAKAGVTASPDFVQNLVSAVVAILNVQVMPAAASSASGS